MSNLIKDSFNKILALSIVCLLLIVSFSFCQQNDTIEFFNLNTKITKALKYNISNTLILNKAESELLIKKLYTKVVEDYEKNNNAFFTINSNLLNSLDKDTLKNIKEDITLNKIPENIKKIIYPYIIKFMIKIFENEDSMNNTSSDDNDVDFNLFCAPCQFVFKNYHNFLENSKMFKKFILFIARIICNQIVDKLVCHNIIDWYGHILIEAVLNHYIEPNYICSNLHFCKNSFKYLSANEFAKEILNDNIKQNIKFSNNERKLKILHLTDVHTDSEYVIGSEGECSEPFCCRTSFDNKSMTFLENYSNKIKSPAGYWGYKGKCDLPYHTIDVLIKQIIEKTSPDLIIWTGDNASHDVWQITKDTPNKATKFVADVIRKYSKDIPVFPSIGNHEEYPVDLFDAYTKETYDKFLKHFSEVYYPFIGEEHIKEYLANGFYSKMYNNNLRIISLNCFLCDAYNMYLVRNPTDPLNQMESLRSVLDISEKNNQKVIIISHIPPGDGTNLSECSKRYNILSERYKNIIVGQYFGHTHMDELKLMTKFYDKSEVYSVSYISPSATTNPSFRVFLHDIETFYPYNYMQYEVDIDEANKDKTASPIINLSYDFNSLYKTNHLFDYENLSKTIDQITDKDRNVYKAIARNFYSNGKDYQEALKRKNDAKELKCKFKKDLIFDFLKCVNYRTNQSEDYGMVLTNVLSGKWFKIISQK